MLARVRVGVLRALGTLALIVWAKGYLHAGWERRANIKNAKIRKNKIVINETLDRGRLGLTLCDEF